MRWGWDVDPAHFPTQFPQSRLKRKFVPCLIPSHGFCTSTRHFGSFPSRQCHVLIDSDRSASSRPSVWEEGTCSSNDLRSRISA